MRLGARGRPLGDMLGDGGRESLPIAGEKAGGRRGCQSHVNLQFSCSFFLQGEGTPNGRLRERAGRLAMVGAGGECTGLCYALGLRPQTESVWALLPRVVLP